MKKILLFLGSLALSLYGCTVHHYEIKGGEAHFYLKAPGAKSVQFASSVDGYDVRTARKIGGSLWEVTLPSDRELRYFYLIDGRTFVPSCSMKEKDDFGSETCIFSPGM